MVSLHKALDKASMARLGVHKGCVSLSGGNYPPETSLDQGRGFRAPRA